MPVPAWLRRVGPFLWYAAMAVAVTWPVAADPFGRLGALSGPGDPYLNLWILGWDLHTFQQAPLDAVNGRIFEAAIFHPARQTLTYSDHLIVVAATVWPLYAMTGSVVFAYNAVLVGSLLAAALTMHALARRVSGSAAGALAAGTVWGFWPYHTAHLGHLQLQALYAMPLAWLALHRLVAGRRLRDAAALGAATAFMAATSVYYGVIGAVGLAVAGVTLMVTTGGRRAGRFVWLLAVAGAIGAVLVAPFVVPYWQSQQREGFARNVYEAARHAATPASYLSAPAVNALYGATGVLATQRGAESELFVGFTALVLAGVGFAAARRFGHRPLAISSLAVAVLGFVLSLGPDGWRWFYVTLHRWVFGFQAIRAPARFGVLVAFGVALLAAIGMKALEARHRGRRGDAAVWRRWPWPCLIVLGLLASEYLNRPLPLVAAPAMETAVGAWLRGAPGAGAVLYLPLAGDFDNTPVMVESLQHRRPIVNGYSGQRPPFYTGLVDAMHGFPSAEAMWALKDFDVRFVVSPARVDTSAWPLIERAVLTESQGAARYIYELAWSDEAEQRLGPPATPVPPEPGAVPFAVGERLTYHVRWQGPAGTLDAGTAVMSVEAPEPGAASGDGRTAAFRFVLTARTAPWIARFFEADDRFETVTDGRLIPIRHARHLREGRRIVDQVASFDTTAGLLQVRSDAGEAVGPPVRLWPHVRDALSLLAYTRTLDLAGQGAVKLPVVDNGRHSIVTLAPAGVETIAVGSRQVRALRLDVNLEQRVQRRSVPDITVWQGRGPTRPLLAAEVRAVFGNLRIELEAPRGES